MTLTVCDTLHCDMSMGRFIMRVFSMAPTASQVPHQLKNWVGLEIGQTDVPKKSKAAVVREDFAFSGHLWP